MFHDGEFMRTSGASLPAISISNADSILVSTEFQMIEGGELYCVYQINVFIPRKGFVIKVNNKEITVTQDQCFLYIPKSIAVDLSDPGRLSQCLFFCNEDNVYIFNEKFTDHHQIEWTFFNKGGFTAIYRTQLKQDLTVDGVTYSSESQLVFRKMLPMFPKEEFDIALNDPQRTARIFNQNLLDLSIDKLLPKASVYETGSDVGVIVPFLEDITFKDIEVEDLHLAILYFYVHTGRVILDGIVLGNLKFFIKEQEKIYISPDVSNAIRSDSLDSTNFFDENKGLYDDWFENHATKYFSSIGVIKAITYLEFIAKTKNKFSFHHKQAARLENDLGAIMLLELAYEDSVKLNLAEVQNYFEDNAIRWQKMVDMNTPAGVVLEYLFRHRSQDISHFAIHDLKKILNKIETSPDIKIEDFSFILAEIGSTNLPMSNEVFDNLLYLKSPNMPNALVIKLMRLNLNPKENQGFAFDFFKSYKEIRDLFSEEYRIHFDKNIVGAFEKIESYCKDFEIMCAFVHKILAIDILNGIFVALSLVKAGMNVDSAIEFVTKTCRDIIIPNDFNLSFVLKERSEKDNIALFIWADGLEEGYSNEIVMALVSLPELLENYDSSSIEKGIDSLIEQAESTAILDRIAKESKNEEMRNRALQKKQMLEKNSHSLKNLSICNTAKKNQTALLQNAELLAIPNGKK